MPYIEQADRDRLDDRFEGWEPDSPGELNYVISRYLNAYLEGCDRLSYQVINDILGALEGAKLEFYERVARPYERSKRSLNGDVYTPRTWGQGKD